MLGEVMDKKKQFLQKRQKRDLRILRQLEDVAREQARVQQLEEALRSVSAEPEEAAAVWSAKTQEIRNKLTGQKRMAKERWNRFAGTSGGGARGL
jgi:hypothetical protein